MELIKQNFFGRWESGFKMKELNETALGKSVQQRGIYQRRAGWGEILPSLEVVFFLRERKRESFDSNKEKVFFSNRVLFNEASKPGTLYVSKIGPAYISIYLPIYIHTDIYT